MNKMPLPIHLLADIPGYALLGQTSFGGYCKIIWAWWLNDCPDVLEHNIEWCSLSGMYQRDYDRHRSKIEPLVLRSLEILKKYRNERRANTANKRAGMLRANATRLQRLKSDKLRDNTKGNIVDKVTPVNPAPAIPTQNPFHEGWNLEQPKSPRINRKTTIAPTLLDK